MIEAMKFNRLYKIDNIFRKKHPLMDFKQHFLNYVKCVPF